MQPNKLILLALIANALSACSSPPKLSEPKGDWISFEVSLPQQTNKNTSTTINPYEGTVLSNVGRPADANNNNLNSLLTQTSPAGGSLIALVKSDGKNIPLYKAVREIVPESMSVRLAPDVGQNFRGTVSWSGNDQWPIVLRKMLATHGLKAEVNPVRGEVVIQYAQKAVAPVSVSPVKPVVTNSAATIQKPAKLLQTPLVPIATEGAKPAPTEKPLLVAKPTPVKPMPAVPVMKRWTLDKGTTLKAGYAGWVEKEMCPGGKGKWTVRWETDTDYPIDYPLSFSGRNFEDVTSQLFNLYRKAQAPLYVSGYRNQCLIVISDRK